METAPEIDAEGLPGAAGLEISVSFMSGGDPVKVSVSSNSNGPLVLDLKEYIHSQRPGPTFQLFSKELGEDALKDTDRVGALGLVSGANLFANLFAVEENAPDIDADLVVVGPREREPCIDGECWTTSFILLFLLSCMGLFCGSLIGFASVRVGGHTLPCVGTEPCVESELYVRPKLPPTYTSSSSKETNRQANGCSCHGSQKPRPGSTSAERPCITSRMAITGRGCCPRPSS
jgi:hypothetical protein